MDSLSHLLEALVDSSLFEIISLSLRVSLSACLIALVIGLPIAYVMATQSFKGRRLLSVICDTLMAQPAVVVGLLVYLLLARNGPLGVWGLLYTPTAMIMAQVILITPLIIALSYPILHQRWQYLGPQLQMLGASKTRQMTLLLQDSRIALTTVSLAAFGRAIAEIGAVMIVGGNIEHQTRVMTTAIAMETQQGNLELAIALGVVLMLIALGVTLLSHWLKKS